MAATGSPPGSQQPGGDLDGSHEPAFVVMGVLGAEGVLPGA